MREGLPEEVPEPYLPGGGMKVAVASTDGMLINQHFGHADRFLVYEVEDGECRLVDERKTDKYCSADPERFESDDVLMRICESLRDCEYLLVNRIGYLPERELMKMGIKTFMLYDRIEDGIKKLPVKPTCEANPPSPH